ncbi:ABC transporter permease [Corynebacterium xerosis]|uniref:ABC transporter permease n=1 Tax=Corynebacterium xerosis TaxID=1725 RepID=UPI000EAB5320|nr:ABC transporter permease [Corynebacterium xerosis]AYJ32839.1 ABC transporter permease [Corynebacterium xerosis]
MIPAVEFGLIYGVMALGVFLTFRILNFADLTVDGSFTTGGATAAVAILAGWNPFLAILAGFATGFAAGLITGLLHTKGNIDGLLAGILTQIGLWSVNLRIMGSSNVPLLREDTIFTPLRDAGLMGSWASVGIFAAVVAVITAAIVWFLNTDFGLAVRATGDNGPMIRSLGVSTDRTKLITLALSNGLVGAAGAVFAQYQGFADNSMGVGLILIGLASVIMGQAILGQRFLWLSVAAVVVGAVLYRLIIFAALEVGLNPNDMKFITAALVVIALLVPQWRAAIGGAIAGSRANRGGAGGADAVTPNTAASASSSNDPAQAAGTMDGKVKA